MGVKPAHQRDRRAPARREREKCGHRMVDDGVEGEHVDPGEQHRAADARHDRGADEALLGIATSTAPAAFAETP